MEGLLEMPMPLKKCFAATVIFLSVFGGAPQLKAEDAIGVGQWTEDAAVRLLAITRLSGEARDLSGLTQDLEDGTPHNRLGGFGSALTYSGRGNQFIALADRGPKDGATSYWTRLHTFDIRLHSGPQWKLDVAIRSTTLFTTQGPAHARQPLVGLSGDLDFRHDPEGIIADDAGFLVAEEYGPTLRRFDFSGRETKQIAIPEKFRIANPAADPDDELPPRNVSGRQPNKGFEGLTRDARRKEVYTILQAPLLQDNALDTNRTKVGRIVRILVLSHDMRQQRELAYVMDSPKNGVSEILALGQMRFLIIERDGKSGEDAKFKKIYFVDASAADDVSNLRSLPCCELPSGVKPVRKSEFIDLIKTSRAFDGSAAPEKPEGLTLGPDLPNGEKLLLVASDNDFEASQSSWIWAYAVALRK